MKKNILINLLLIALLVPCNNICFSQVNSSKTTLAKAAIKSGRYAGTYQLNNGNISIFYQTAEGVYAYEFSSNTDFIKEYQGEEALSNFSQITNKSIEQKTNVGLKEYEPTEAMNVMFAGSSWGILKFQKGTLYLKSNDKFIYGFGYTKSEAKKLKIEDTWRTIPIGNRAIIPDDLKKVLFKGYNGEYMSYTFSSVDISLLAPITGYIQSAGIITEKVSIKNPSPYNSNRLAIYRVGGKTFEETNNIHIMPYAMQGVGSGISTNDNFIVLTMPLNAPSTVKEQKALVAPEADRNNLYIYEIDDNNQVVSEAIHQSDLRTVNFQVVSTEDKTFIVGTGKEGKNWRLFYAGQSDMDGLTIAVLDKEGKIIGSQTYLDDTFLGKYEIPGEGKSKFQRFTGGPNFYRAEKLENGNTFIYGKSDAHHHGILLSATNELIKYYVFPHADMTKNIMYSDQLEVRGNNIYIVLTDQPGELSNEVQKSTESSSHTTGNIRTTTTTTTITQFFEIYHLSQLFTIDGTTGKSTQLSLDKIQKDFYTLGDTPVFFGEDAIYFGGRIKAKGKELSLIKIDY